MAANRLLTHGNESQIAGITAVVWTRSIADRFESRQDLPQVLIKKDEAVDFFESGSELVWIVTLEDRTVLVLRPDGSEAVATITVVCMGRISSRDYPPDE